MILPSSRFFGAFFQHSDDNYRARIIIHIIIHANVVNPQPVLAPKGLLHFFDARAADSRGVISQMPFDGRDDLLAIKCTKLSQIIFGLVINFNSVRL
jgi:hypothetical protein